MFPQRQANNDGNQTCAVFNNIEPGLYQVTATNANGCVFLINSGFQKPGNRTEVNALNTKLFMQSGLTTRNGSLPEKGINLLVGQMMAH